MKPFILILAVLCIWAKLAHGVETLTFDVSTSPNVVYELSWGSNATGIIATQPLGTNNLVALTNGPWGAFFFQVVAVSTNGVKSLPSNTLAATNRPDAPLQLRLVPWTNVVFLDGSIDGTTWRRLANITKTPALLAATSNQLFRASILPPLPP